MVQFTVQIHLSAAPERPEYLVSDLPEMVQLADTECEINNWILPMKTSPQRHICPAIETMNEHWCPWDDSLEEEFIFHLAILDVSLFQQCLRLGRSHGLTYTYGRQSLNLLVVT